MYFVYSIILSLAFLLMLPMFLLRREKYASGFSQRLGNYPEFRHDGRAVIWLHCVSVGETNAARPLVEKLRAEFPGHRLVISTTTRTGQELARKLFADDADAVVYFPFDWKFSVRRALTNYKPSLVLLMETEIWPRFVHEAKLTGAKVAIVNGRLSEKSFRRYSKVGSFIRAVLNDVDIALMQNEVDATRIGELGIASTKVAVTGNLKFEQAATETERALTESFRSRFGISPEMPLIIAASTHEPEEKYVVDALDGKLGSSCRLMIVPRHPERFDLVAKQLEGSGYSFVRRSSSPSDEDTTADVILLDSIGELRAAYPLAEIVFVGGSLIPHGGQSILEPATAGKAIVTGPHTENFSSVVRSFLENDAVIQLEQISELEKVFDHLLEDSAARRSLGERAGAMMQGSGGGTEKTIQLLRRLTAE